MSKKLPQVPYGAVYFRKSNPPKEDWARDYAVASEDGMNIFRHWFMWGAIETSPGHYDWEEYDKQLDLAAANGMTSIIAEMITSVPEWASHQYKDAIQITVDGAKVKSQMGASSATGGFGGTGVLCLDCDEVKEAAGEFLKALVLRYKDHESMTGYDIWNECHYSTEICYCEHTQAKYRTWLKQKYGDLKSLNNAWHKYSYAQWEQVSPPNQIGPYPECMDWLFFKKENFFAQMQWRIDLIRSLDSENLITAHGLAGSISHMATMGSDDWLAASKVDVYGLTWVASRQGSEPWKQWHAIDITRAASQGKPFWHAEAQGGPLWLQPQVIGRAKEDGRMTEPEDLRIWNMISLAAGAKGLLFPRWRPLLDGPLFGAFGPYAMDGTRTANSMMASTVAKWANASRQQALFQSSPIQGEIGILALSDVQYFDYLLNHNSQTKLYSNCMLGAYRGFFDNNIQADWVHLNQLDQYEVIYLPYPILLTTDQATRITKWVEKGGKLICEGCPGYFGERGKVGTVQPNLGLDQLFGVLQEEVEFMPDILGDLTFTLDENSIDGGVYLQSYIPKGGKLRGQYPDGRAAVVENTYGSGSVLLMGTFPSEAYYRKSSEANRKFFSDLLTWSGKAQHVKVSSRTVQARLHDGDGGKYLWVLNPSRQAIETDLEISSIFGEVSMTNTLWGEGSQQFQGNKLTVRVPARDVLILQLEGRDENE